MNKRRGNILATVDWTIIILYLVMMLLGWINIYAAVYNPEHHSIFDLSQRYGKQLIWIVFAIVLAFFVMLIDERFYSLFAYVIYGFTILLLLAVLVIGKEINGAKSWIVLGGIQVQPSEFAKIGTALALARYMSSYSFKLHNFKSYLKIAAIVLLPATLVMIQPDMGSAIVYFVFILVLYREGLSPVIPLIAIYLGALFIMSLVLDVFILTLIMMVFAGIIYWIISKKPGHLFYAAVIFGALFLLIYFMNIKMDLGYSKYVILLGCLGLSILIYIFVAIKHRIQHVMLILVLMLVSLGFTYSVDYAVNNVLKDHQQKRINILLGLEEDPQGAGYNVQQSKIAIGSGGFSGKGFLQGTQTKYKFVPEQSTDFIFCTVGEEWGFLGTTTVVVLFIILLTRLVMLAERQKTAFNRIYGYGVISILLFHVTINIGMTIGLFPVIGIPLPFFSYGGSSLWAFTILLFIFLRLDAERMEKMR
jgi:rod shape determining protein RodA